MRSEWASGPHKIYNQDIDRTVEDDAVNRISFGLTDIGRRRLSNEDSFLVDNELGLYVVADGMGGHNAGEVASGEAVDALHSMVRQQEDALIAIEGLPRSQVEGDVTSVSLRQLKRLVESAVQAATYMVFGLGQANPERKGMGTTLSVLLLRGDYAITAQVGDSRIYLMRDGSAEQVTEDHTLVAWQLKRGLITAEEARNSKQKNVITRAVGSREYVEVDTRLILAQPGDRFLLCSDGLHSYLADDEIAALRAGSPRDAVGRAIEIANQRGGRDNITAIVVELA
jgi:serine/threonine protein phosphatase PrpC